MTLAKTIYYFVFWLAVAYFTDPGWTALLLSLITFLIFDRSSKSNLEAMDRRIETIEKSIDRISLRLEKLEK